MSIELQKKFKLVEESANENLKTYLRANSDLLPLVFKEISTLFDMADRRSFDIKLKELYRIVEKLTTAVNAVTPCKKGCSDCCKQATIILQAEADALAKRVNTVLDKPSSLFELSLKQKFKDYQTHYKGSPCPFLSDSGECSVYDDRPLICRLHHNLSSFPEMCDITLESEKTCIPELDLGAIMSTALAHCGFNAGEIREYFKTYSENKNG